MWPTLTSFTRDICTTPDLVADLGTVLGIWAHPDDEAYLSGGLMSIAARDHGNRVACVTATRGELGTADPEPGRLRGWRPRVPTS